MISLNQKTSIIRMVHFFDTLVFLDLFPEEADDTRLDQLRKILEMI